MDGPGADFSGSVLFFGLHRGDEDMPKLDPNRPHGRRTLEIHDDTSAALDVLVAEEQARVLRTGKPKPKQREIVDEVLRRGMAALRSNRAKLAPVSNAEAVSGNDDGDEG